MLSRGNFHKIRPAALSAQKSLFYCTICRKSVIIHSFVRQKCRASPPVFHIRRPCGKPLWKTLWTMWKLTGFPQLSPGSPNFWFPLKQENLWESHGKSRPGAHVFHRKTANAPKIRRSQMIAFFQDSARFPQARRGAVRQIFVKYPQRIPYQTNVSGNTEIVTNSVGEALK